MPRTLRELVQENEKLREAIEALEAGNAELRSKLAERRRKRSVQ